MRAKNTLLTTILSAAIACTIAAPAHADRWGHGDIRHFHDRDWGDWHHGYWHHDWHDGHFGWWWVVGGVWFFYPAPIYPYPNPYVPPGYPLPVAWESPPAYWYFCLPANAYYPYVQACPGGWQPVPAKPPR